MAAAYPQFIPQAFANGAAGPNRNTIPDAPIGLQRASFDLGFPPQTMLPRSIGGKPMLGPDMNGVLYMMSSHQVYAQTGQPYRYNADVSVSIGGYAVGTLLGSIDGSTLFYNILANNTSDPDAEGAGWVAMFSYGITNVPPVTGGVLVLTLAQAKKSVIVLTGALIANQQIVMPAQVRRWLIVNATTGNFTLTVKTAGGTGVIVPQGGFNAPAEVWGDATNIYNVVAPVNLPIDQAATPLTIAQRTNVGYLLATYFNQSSALENFAMAAVYADAGDGFHRKISPANFQAQLPVSAFPGQVTNAQVPQSAVTQHAAALFLNAALTGTPTAPTAAPGTNTTQIASTAFVQASAGVQGIVALPGYIRFANGIIVQWGFVNYGASNNRTVLGAQAYSVPFPTACAGVWINNAEGGQSVFGATVGFPGTASFVPVVIQREAGGAFGAGTLMWIAVGF